MHLRPQTLTPTQTQSAVAVVIVHYRTPHLAAQAVAALRQDLASAPLRQPECLIVDNGNDADGIALLRDLDVAMLAPDRNLGYAGGVNLGVAHTSAPFVIVMNADVLVRPGCIAALIDELRSTGCAVAGPRFSWDRDGRLLLPPTERRDVASGVLARLGARDARWARAARKRWRRHARRHWTARTSVDSYALSGALLAFRREVWDAVGPFDEAFQLYFEETDWLARLATRGWRGRYVATAQAVHLYNRSAGQEAAAAEWFAASARRFEEKHVSRIHARVLRWLEAQPHAGASANGRSVAATAEPLITLPAGESRTSWIEISSQPTGYPAAAQRLEASAREWRLPPDVWQHLAPGQYTLRQVDDAGRECGETMFTR